MILLRVKISGHSMLPTFKPGDQILVSTLPYWFSEPQTGEVVVFQKKEKIFIKRITKATSNGFIVSGDNSRDSFDSKNFGIIKRKDILGKVILKL